jgi:hypothetical protein
MEPTSRLLDADELDMRRRRHAGWADWIEVRRQLLAAKGRAGTDSSE